MCTGYSMINQSQKKLNRFQFGEVEDAANRLEDKCSLARLIVPLGMMAPTWFIRDGKWVGEEAPAKVPGGAMLVLNPSVDP